AIFLAGVVHPIGRGALAPGVVGAVVGAGRRRRLDGLGNGLLDRLRSLVRLGSLVGLGRRVGGRGGRGAVLGARRRRALAAVLAAAGAAPGLLLRRGGPVLRGGPLGRWLPGGLLVLVRAQ